MNRSAASPVTVFRTGDRGNPLSQSPHGRMAPWQGVHQARHHLAPWSPYSPAQVVTLTAPAIAQTLARLSHRPRLFDRRCAQQRPSQPVRRRRWRPPARSLRWPRAAPLARPWRAGDLVRLASRHASAHPDVQVDVVDQRGIGLLTSPPMGTTPAPPPATWLP
jgi:hypothetical protein